MVRSIPEDSVARFALVGCTNFVVSFTAFVLSFNYLPPGAVAALAGLVGGRGASSHTPPSRLARARPRARVSPPAASRRRERDRVSCGHGEQLPAEPLVDVSRDDRQCAAAGAALRRLEPVQPHDGYSGDVRPRRRARAPVARRVGSAHGRGCGGQLRRLQALGVRAARGRHRGAMTRAAGGARLIVNADDFGLSEAVNRAVIEAHEHGIVTSTSIMAGGSAFEHAAALATRTPTLDVGVHLTLTEQQPVAESVPSLVGADGQFAPHATDFAKRWLRGTIALADVRTELDAQIRRVRAHGVRPTHLDGHQHVHVLPGIARVVAELAREHGIRAVRVPTERPRSYMLKDLGGAKRL